MEGKCCSFGDTFLGNTVTLSFIVECVMAVNNIDNKTYQKIEIMREKACKKFHEGVNKEKVKQYYENKTEQT